MRGSSTFTEVGTSTTQKGVESEETNANFTDPIEITSRLKRPKSNHAIHEKYLPSPQRSLPKAKSKSKLKSKPIHTPNLKPRSKPKETEQEKEWPCHGIIASGFRECQNKSRLCYLIEWKENWAPTWQQKDDTKEELIGEWKEKCEAWKAHEKTQGGTREGRRLEKEKRERRKKERKAEGILFDEDGSFLMGYGRDLRPEWVKMEELEGTMWGEGLIEEYREKKWDILMI